MAIFGKSLQQGPDHKGETTYIMYHGTTMKAAQKIKRRGFIRSADGMLGPGVYVSRSFAKAACYPRGAKGQKRAVLKLSVCVGKVKAIDRQGHHLQKSWHQAGYDTAWVPPNCGMVKSGRQENCVWDPKRIRVLSIKSNDRESSEEESTDRSLDEEDNSDDEEEDGEYETYGDSESVQEERSATEDVSDEESIDCIDERPSGRQENCVWDPKRIRVLSIQSNDRESSEEESTDRSLDEEDNSDDEEEDGEYETYGDSESVQEERSATEDVSDEESIDSIDERPSRRSSDTSTDEYVNTDDTSPDHVDDRYSHHGDNHDEASDEDGSSCDERNNVFTETDASESSGESCDKYCSDDESDDDF